MSVFLTLGPITFANNEVPPFINFGGAQMISTKKLIGGQRIIDDMGRDDDDINWRGLFFGSTATFRARYLDGMRVNGTPLPLTWTQFNYLVVIQHFHASFERFYQIPYTINVRIVQDLNQPFPVLLPVAYNDAILNAMIEANDLAEVIANPSISSALAILSTVINSIPSLSDASNEALAAVLAATLNAESVTTSAIDALNASIFQ